MSNALALAAPGEEVQPGQIRFAQAALTPLVVGQYEVTGRQTVEKLKDRDEPPVFSAAQKFHIQGPRFALAPGDLQMVQPPANQPGNWENTLPAVVLRRRTIPWEVSLDGKLPEPGKVPPPWLALICVTAAELSGDAGAIEAPAPVRSGKVAQLVNTGDPVILGPSLTGLVSAADLATDLLLLDLDATLFQSVAPALADLPWLAHVREVNTGQKEILGLDEDGVFSVVVGNRTVQAGAPGGANTVNYLFLVSLEGHQDHLAGATLPAGVKTIRFASLAWWKTEVTALGDFIEIMQALPRNGGVNLSRLDAATAPPPPVTDPEKAADIALNMGYVPMTYRMRAGEQATAWYRGPTSAVPTRPDGLGPQVFSDKAIRYDPDTGLFDISQAAAWQIGRLLALSDSSFARHLFDWRKSRLETAVSAVTLAATLRDLPPRARLMTNDTGLTPSAHARLAAAGALGDAFAALAAEGANEAVDETVNEAAPNPEVPKREAQPAIPLRVRREDRPAHAAVPGLLPPEARDGFSLRDGFGEDLTPDDDPLDALLTHVFGGAA